jgi:hypothetical protein
MMCEYNIFSPTPLAEAWSVLGRPSTQIRPCDLHLHAFKSQKECSANAETQNRIIGTACQDLLDGTSTTPRASGRTMCTTIRHYQH